MVTYSVAPFSYLHLSSMQNVVYGSDHSNFFIGSILVHSSADIQFISKISLGTWLWDICEKLTLFSYLSWGIRLRLRSFNPTPAGMGGVLARTPWFLPSSGLNPRVAYMCVRLNPTGFISHPIPPQTAGISPGFDPRLPPRGRKPRLVFSKEKGGEGKSGGGGGADAGREGLGEG